MFGLSRAERTARATKAAQSIADEIGRNVVLTNNWTGERKVIKTTTNTPAARMARKCSECSCDRGHLTFCSRSGTR